MYADEFYTKRVHRFELIPMIDPPRDLDGWLKPDLFSESMNSAFKIRDGIFRMPAIEYKALEMIMKDPEFAERAAQYSGQKAMVAQETDQTQLLDYLEKTEEYMDARFDIINRLLQLNTDVYLLFFERLNDSNDHFLDDALRVVARTYAVKDVSGELLSLLKKNRLRDPFNTASILQTIGWSKNKTHIQLLYSYYRYFQDNFSDEDFFEGPLFGLSYLLR